MHRLFPQKLLTIVTLEILEECLAEIVRKNGASGYTIVKASGAGSSGKISGELDVDTNIKFHVIVPQGNMTPMLDDVEALIHEGHHLTVFVSDVAVLSPEKFETPLAEQTAD
ncbi:MAG: transcriptional regulator [Pseudomonadota bacterium]